MWDNERFVFEWGSRQTYLALANMMTAAQIGIDSCPIEGFVKDAGATGPLRTGLVALNLLPSGGEETG